MLVHTVSICIRKDSDSNLRQGIDCLEVFMIFPRQLLVWYLKLAMMFSLRSSFQLIVNC
jgi:hypothetical protein